MAVDAEAPADVILTVVIVENHAIYRRGLRAQFETDSAIRVIAEFGNAVDAVQGILELRPSVVLMDLHLPLKSGAHPTYCGAQAIEEILKHWPEANIAVITMFGDEERIREALKAGARSFVSKDGEPDEVVPVVRLTAQGIAVLNYEASVVVKKILPNSSLGARSFSELTPRENEQLALAAAGLTDRQIADKLKISTKTVANNWPYIRGKLGVATRDAAVELARANGFRPGQEPSDGPGELG
jgi:DNA-binding NarL/FixJ family response regulator